MSDVLFNHVYYNVHDDEWCVVTGFPTTCDDDERVAVIWESGISGFALVSDLREEEANG